MSVALYDIATGSVSLNTSDSTAFLNFISSMKVYGYRITKS
jgi:hypothetical protein